MTMRRCCTFVSHSSLAWNFGHADSLVCSVVGRRFLRARRFDVIAAFGQFKDTEDWRRDNAIEALYENIDVHSYEAARRMVWSYLDCFCPSKQQETPASHLPDNTDDTITSTRNGPADAITAGSPYTSSKSEI